MKYPTGVEEVVGLGKKVFSNAVILAGEELEVTRGYMVMDKGIIKEISEGSSPRRATSLKGGFVIPPFVNAHTHVVDSVAKDLYIGRSQEEVVGPEGIKFRALEASSRRKIERAAKATLQEMIQTGTLAHCDFREGGLQGISLLRKISQPHLKSIILGRVSRMKELPEVLESSDGVGLPRVDAFSQEEMKKISTQTLRANKLFSVHAAETEEDQMRSMKKFGMSETAQAISLGCSFVVHATHSGEDDFSKLKRDKIPVVFCPRSNSLLSVGVPPLKTALEVGAEFFLGTDNAMVCQPNVFQELSFAWMLLRRADAGFGSEEARKLLQSATVGPSKFFELPWAPIVEGQPATFLMLGRGNNLVDLSDTYAGLVNRARAENIKTIYLNGKMIYRLKH